MGTVNPTGFSADVRLWLERDDVRVSLSHTADTFIIARAAVDLPPGDATVVFTVDGVRYERGVRLPDGMSAGSAQTAVQGDVQGTASRPARDR